MMKLILLWSFVQRPWGFEVRADYDDDGRIHNEVFVFPKEPEKDLLDRTAEERRLKLIETFHPSKARILEDLNREIVSANQEITAAQARKSVLLDKITAASLEAPK